MKVITETEVIDLGTTETTPTIGITDYSRRVTDDFGVTTVVERGFSRRMSLRFALPLSTADEVQRKLAALRAKPCRWIADDRFAWLDVTGFYKDFALDLNVPPLSFCTLTVEGLAELEAGADAGGDPAPSDGASTLRLVQPLDITGPELAVSSVPENDYSEWSALTIYPLGTRVIKATAHRVYESAAPANAGHDPAGSSLWIDIGPTNRWAMFDQALGTATSAAGAISVTINASNVTAVALLDVAAATVRVQADGYDRTLPVGDGAIAFLDLPEIDGALTVTVAGPAQVSVGTLLVGTLVTLGVTEASPSAAIADFSRKEADDFGEVTIVERAWAKRMTTRALIRTDAIDLVANRIAAVRARPSLWIGDDDLDCLMLYGFFKDFSIEVGENVSTLSLSVEGLSEAAALASDDNQRDRGLFRIDETYEQGDITNLIDGSRWEYSFASPTSGNGPAAGSVFWKQLLPAVIPVSPAGTPLIDLLNFAQETADRKASLFWRAAPPSAAESSEGDRWVDTANGNREYRRVAGSGRLALGGNAITLGGAYLSLAWTPADDQRIGAAVLASAGAQATADGKVQAFTMFAAGDPVPVGEGVGDLLFRLYLSPAQIDRWNGAGWAPASTYGATSAQAAAITASTNAVSAILSNDVLDRGEKAQFGREWQQTQARYLALDGKAATFGGATIAALRAALTSAYTELALIIGSISPAYSDASQDSPLGVGGGAAVNAKWADFYTAYAALDVAISGMTVIAQWSVDGAGGWHDDFAEGDKWQRQSSDLGASWDAPIKVVGEDGANGQYTSSVFKRSAAQPDAPAGDVTPPAGWSDDPPPPGDPVLPLWQSQRVFRDAAPVAGSVWSTPIKLIAASLADLDPGAAELLNDAKAIADGKNKIFWQSTPPTMVESQPSDWWVNTAQGNRTYRRMAGTGVLAIGGSTVTLSGNHIVLGWTEMGDARVAQALDQTVAAISAASAAQVAANAAADKLSKLDDDGQLTPSEKRDLATLAAELEGAWSAMDALAASLGITTERTAAASARTAWLTVLASIPNLSDPNVTSPVNYAAYQAALDTYQAVKLPALQAKIGATAATRADWPTITGAGKPENGADVTLNAQFSVDIGNAFEISFDYTGVTASGVPRVIPVTVTRGGNNVTTDNAASYSVANFTGSCTNVNVTVDNVNGSGTKGRPTIVNGSAAPGTFDWILTYSGVQVAKVTIQITKKLAAAPAGSGSGSSGYSKNGTFDAGSLSVSTTSYAELGRVSNLVVANGETIYASFYGLYHASGGGNFISRYGVFKLQYSAAGAGSWTDFGPTVQGGTATFSNLSGDDNPGDITISQSPTSAPAAGNYDVRVVGVINSTLASAALTFEAPAPGSVVVKV